MTSSDTKKETHRARRREQILQAAIACFSRKGYHLTTMDHIVAESGMSKGSLYWYYKSKRDILFAVMDWYFGQVTEEMMAAIQQAPTAAGKLNIILDLFSGFVATEDSMVNVLIDFYAETRNDEDVTEALRQGLLPYIDLIADIVQAGIAGGEFKPVDSRRLAAVLMAASDGLLLYQTVLKGDFDWREMGRLLTDTLLAGLLTERRF